MKYAWIENDKVRDTATDPKNQFHPSVAVYYDTEVPDEVQSGWEFLEGAWVAPAVPEIQEPIETPIVYLKISPVEFKLLFTGPERIAIRAAATTDALIEDFYEIIDDPRLTVVDLGLKSTQDGIGYLASLGLIVPERVPEILTGIFK